MNKLLSIFFEEDPKESKANVATVVNNTSIPTPSYIPPTPSGDVQEINQKMIEFFDQVLKDENLPGPDYYEFSTALDAMKSSGLPDDKLFTMTWATFKAMAPDKSKDDLIKAAKHYLNKLTETRTNFLNDIDSLKKEKLENLSKEQLELESSNKSAIEKINSLQQEILGLQQSIEKNNARALELNNSIITEQTKTTQKINGFESTYKAYVSQINSDIEKISNFIK